MQRELKFLLKFKAELRALRKAREGFKKLAAAEKRIAAGAKEVTATTTAASTSVNRFGVAAKRASATATAGFTRVAAAMARVGALLGTLGLGIGLGVAVQTVAAFGASMSRVQAITGELERDLSGKLNPTFAALSETVRRLGATTVFTASQAADAFGLLAQAGFDAGEAITATSAVLDLAVVGAIDLASSANFVANAIRGFGLAAGDAGRVADVFAATITRSNTDVTQLGEALKFVAPIARSMGISIEEAAAAVGVLSDAGLKGTLAGTGLRRVLIGLASQTPKATATLKDAGVNIENLQNAIQGGGGLNEALKEFEGRQLSAAEAVDVFGLRGGPAFLVLQRMAKETGSLTEALKLAEDEALRFAEIARDNLAGDLKLLRSVIEDSILGTGGLNKAFREITQTIAGVVQVFAGTLDPLDENAKKFREIADAIRTVGTVIKVLIASFIALKAAMLISSVIGGVSAAFAAMGVSATGAGIGVTALTNGLRILKIALVTTGIGALVVALGSLAAILFTMDDALEGVNDTIDAAQGGFKRAGDVVERLGDLSGRAALVQLPSLRDAVESAARGLESLTNERDRLERTADSLDRLGETRGGIAAMFEVVGNADLTPFEQLKAITLGILPGFEIGSVAAEDMRAKIGPLAKAIGVAESELEEFEAALRKLEDLQKAQDEVDKTTQEIESLGIKIGDTRKVLEEFSGLAEKGIKEINVQIGDLSLGAGKVADLQRDINKELRKAGLEVEIPVELTEARKAAADVLIEAQEGLQRATAAANAEGVEGGKALIAQAQVRLVDAQRLNAEAENAIKVRGEERQGIVDAVTARNTLTEANKRVEDAEKAIGKVRADRLTIDQRVLENAEKLTEQNDILRAAGSNLALSDEELNKVLEEQEKKLRKGTDEFKRREQAIKDAATAEKAFKDGLVKLNAELDVQFNSVGKTSREIEEMTIRADLLTQANKGLERGIDESAEAFEKRRAVTLKAAEADVEAFLARKRLADQAQSADIIGSARRQIEDFVDASTDAAAITEQAFSTAFSALDTQLKSFVKTGVFDFREFALTILDEIAVLAAKAAIASALKPLVGGAGGGGIGAIVAQGLGLVSGQQQATPAGAGPGIIGAAAGAAAGGGGGAADAAGAVADMPGIMERGFGKLAEIGKAGLKQGVELAGTVVSGITSAISFLGGLLSTVFTAVGSFLAGVFTAVTTVASAVVSGAVAAGSFLVAGAVQVGAALVSGAQFITNAILFVIQGFQLIIAAFAAVPFFHGGGISTGGGSGTASVPASAFLGARRFGAGGISDEDNIPALLKPGEAVVPLAGGAIPVQITPSGDQSPTREPRSIVVSITVNANDAESFVESQQEIATKMAEEIRAAEERNR